MLKGFNRLGSNITLPRRLVMRIGGHEKRGKTHFALTAPAPIAVLNIDRGLEGVVEKFSAIKEIHVSENFRDMPATTQKENEERWAAIVECYWSALGDKNIRSIIWDTDTEAWEIDRLAYFGKLLQIKSHHYATINREFRGLVDAALSNNKNVIFICRMKKQYIKSKKDSDDAAWNGLYETAGFGDLPAVVQVNLLAKMAKDKDGGIDIPTIEVVNCRQNMRLNGEVFEGDMATFSWVAANIIGGTSPEDWE